MVFPNWQNPKPQKRKAVSQLVPAVLQDMPLVSLFLAITRLEIKNLVLSRVPSLLSKKGTCI